MPETPVVPFLAKSALFIAGMTGRCPGLRAVTDYAARDARVAPERRNLVLEKLFRSLPALPAIGDPDITAKFAAMSDQDIAALEGRQTGRGADALRAAWHGVVEKLDDEAERDLARRCGVVLTELFRRRAAASRIRPSVSRKNA